MKPKLRASPREKSAQSSKPTTASVRSLEGLAGSRIAIEAVEPEINGGRFSAKAALGERVRVAADIFCDGHDIVDAAVLFRVAGSRKWREAPMRFSDNDRWRGSFLIEKQAPYEFMITAWRDLFGTWKEEVQKKVAAGQRISSEVTEGERLVAHACDSDLAGSADQKALDKLRASLASAGSDEKKLDLLLAEETNPLFRRTAPRSDLTHYEKVLLIWVDRPKAVFSSWYELMPRSQSGDTERHGTFDDVIKRLPYIRGMGFDVLYMPPIHPIGQVNRKGKNNTLTPGPNDPGSPYAIGSSEGGHHAIHRELGDFDDFARLVEAADEHGLEIALDFAIQCAPDHPWIKQHPEWFDWRPDGTIKYAENPPKKYEDIVNVHFYRDAFPSLWYALRDIVLFWAKQRVRIFRVDNPHTKPLPFWEWMIAEVHAQYPDVIFLAEAFTRPKMMKRLAKIGFTQSYSYFTWRNTKQELTDYLTELTQSECRHYMRPNFFVNTPDINPYYLQTSGRPGFQVRLVLAATLAGNYGIYSGFELCEAAAIPGREEYLDSEKYEIRAWDWDRPGHIREDIALLNRLRTDHAALQEFTNLQFYNIWNENILYYGRQSEDLSSFVLIAVNLDPNGSQDADFEVPLWEFNLPDDASIEAEDLITGDRFTWTGKIQHLYLDPAKCPYAIWRIISPEGAS